MSPSATRIVDTVLLSRRRIVGALAAFAGGLAMRRADAASPPAITQEETYNGRSISLQEEGGDFVVRIDGTPVDFATRFAGEAPLDPSGTPIAAASPEALFAGEYSSDIFPFRTFESPEAIARALVDTEGQLWLLDPQ